MDKFTAEAIAKKILARDYDRWVQYMDECVKDRKAFTKSFYVWKDDKGMIDEDARTLADVLTE